MEIEWKKITAECTEVFRTYYEMVRPMSCEFSVGNNVLWSDFYHTKWAIVEDALVFYSGEEKESVSFPLYKEFPRKAIDALTEWFMKRDKPFRIHLVTKEQFNALEENYPGRFEIHFYPEDADYIYESEKLISLAGKKLHAKRNHINRFCENYPDWKYERITQQNLEECVTMAYEWRENSAQGDAEKDAEFQVTLKAIRNLEQLHLTGGLLRANGKVAAFTVGEPISDEVFVVHIEKAHAEIQGAYPMINQQFIQNEASAYRYINREEDVGDEGLRKAKQSYAPVFLLEKGIVTEKQ